MNKLHPTVEEFKEFMNNHPTLVLELRKSGDSLQDYYNKWVEHGEDSSVWNLDKAKDQMADTKDKDFFHQIIKYTENIDINKIEGRVKQFNKALDTIQLLLGNFIKDKETNVDVSNQKELFNFFRD